MIVAILLDAAATMAAVPAGVPYADSPVPVARLRGLDAHPWRLGPWTLKFSIDQAGRGLLTLYSWQLGETFSLATSFAVFFTERDGGVVASSTGRSLRDDNPDAIKPSETCFSSRAILWSARHFYFREVNVAATRRANPWLGRTATSDPFCPLALGHLSSTDQARLVIRWGRERRADIGPMPPPPAPAARAPYVFDADHRVDESSPDFYEKSDWVRRHQADLKRSHR